MTSQRDDNRHWLEGTGPYAGREPGEWATKLVKLWGLEGVLDFLDATAQGGVSEVKLTRRPWVNHPHLKELVRNVRAAEHELARALWSVEAEENRWARNTD